MSSTLPPSSLIAPEVPTLAPRQPPPPQAGALRPRALQPGTRRPEPIPKASFTVASVLKLLCLLGIVGFGFVQYQNHNQGIQDSLQIEKASSVAIQGAGTVDLFLLSFSRQGMPGLLLWKAGPGIERVAGPGNRLQSLSGHTLTYGALGKTNYVNSDFTIVSLTDEQIPYSTSPHAYNHPEITNLLPVIR